jgi:hypothetical protein
LSLRRGEKMRRRGLRGKGEEEVVDSSSSAREGEDFVFNVREYISYIERKYIILYYIDIVL